MFYVLSLPRKSHIGNFKGVTIADYNQCKRQLSVMSVASRTPRWRAKMSPSSPRSW